MLRSLRISGYQLFPGDPSRAAKNGPGLHFSVPKGVTVVIGINGLGKTTLLNAIFRALSGPTDWKRRSLDKPAGSSPIDTGPWRTPAYFKQRVADEASEADIDVVVSFADQELFLRRSLNDLTLSELQLNGKPLEATEAAYRAEIQRLAGVNHFDDFFVLLRYLVFFLEERPPLVWDADAQTDILRVLFYDPLQSGAARKYFDRIQKADSRYRNLRPTYRKLQAQLATAQSASSDPGTAAEFKATQTQIAALTAEQRQLEKALHKADAERKRLRLKHEQAKLIVAEQRDAYATVEQHQLAALFPEIGSVARYIFLRADTGCLVCGSRTDAAIEHIKERTASGHCPLCDAPTSEQESQHAPGVTSAPAVARRRLEGLRHEVETAENNEAQIAKALGEAVSAYEQLLERALAVNSELSEATRSSERLRLGLPPTASELEELNGALKALSEEMGSWERKRQAAESKYRRVLARGEERIRGLALEVADRFADFASAFLEETCDIQYETQERRIGQEGASFAFPQFTVRLTSAVSLDEPQPRITTTDVSESQKEYIDLAFRMALMAVAAGATPLMLVLETPEASLDAHFISRAGGLFGDFAAGGGRIGNRLIASSNLTNNGDMISSLLGALPALEDDAPQPPHYIAPADRPRHIIDLVHEAAPNTALLQHKSLYEQLLAKAVYPEATASAERGRVEPAPRKRKSGKSRPGE